MIDSDISIDMHMVMDMNMDLDIATDTDADIDKSTLAAHVVAIPRHGRAESQIPWATPGVFWCMRHRDRLTLAPKGP